MTNHASDGDEQQADDREPEADEMTSIETYETNDGVVFYDAENPLAWLEANETCSLRERA
ncbi:hypothetical protein G9C85_13235 [Halorubellus sp. JP-L1]|uniref:DUF7331 family protein n=1 Tax=Halorubellus sp. JP-L1 TaxID=2715753 RepID=UPI00140B673A|nr:hypothetical protein [Halorubellus sp. JP-L1]NHN42584.1 hypothetical protein [Halorubellus sp. JP-L1]